jgi:tyrosine-protein kinase Etk/Wzc
MTPDNSLPAHNAFADNDDEIDLRELLAVLWNGKLTLCLILFGTLLLGMIYFIAARPIYQADGLVQVEQDDKNSLTAAMGDMASLFGAPAETSAEIEILQSRMILTKVIEDLNLEIDAEPAYFPIFGRFIAQHRDGLTSLFGLGRFAWGAQVIEVSRLALPADLIGEDLSLEAEGNGKFRLLDPDGKLLVAGSVGTLATAGEIQIFVRQLEASAGTLFNVRRNSLANVLKGFTENLKVAEQGKQSGVIGITYQNHGAELAAEVIRHIEDAYVRQNVERRSAEAQQSLDFLKKQLPEIRANVDAAQAKLNAYQMKQGSVDVTKETELVLQQSVDLETARLQLVQQRQQALQRFTPEHPAIKAIDSQIRGIEQEQADIKKRSTSLPETQQEVLSLMRDLEVNTQIYTTLLNSTQELQVTKAGTVGNVRIIDYPLVSDKRAKPKAALVLAIAFALGVFLGVSYLFVRKILFHGVDRPDEIEQAFGLATYAAIPFAAAQRRMAKGLRGGAGNHILAMVDPTDVSIEALRSFRTSLQFAMMEAPNNIVMFTGPTPGLGKSFVSINLGAVLATSGKKVVIVDADLRRGHLHKYIGKRPTPGLSDYIAGNADIPSIVRNTPVAGLGVVVNGTTPPNPAELLMHDRFGELVAALSKIHDLVIVDTPPILPVTDAGIVGRHAGSVFMILKEGEHPLRMIEESIRRLRQAGVSLRGAIFNQVGASRSGQGYYGSYHYTYQSKYRSVHR